MEDLSAMSEQQQHQVMIGLTTEAVAILIPQAVMLTYGYVFMLLTKLVHIRLFP